MKYFIIALLIGLGLGSCFYFYGKLDYAYEPNQEYWTSIQLKNSRFFAIEVQQADLYIAEAFHFEPTTRPPNTPLSYEEIIFKRVETENGEDEIRKFYNPDTKIIIPGRSDVKVRIRVKNIDYPGLQLIGELRLKHSNGELSLKNVCVDVESW